MAQWIRLCAPNAGGLGSIPGQGTRSHMHAATEISHATTKQPAAATKTPRQKKKNTERSCINPPSPRLLTFYISLVCFVTTNGQA